MGEKNDAILRLVALEAHETVDYGMPLRCMNYDAQEYSRQARTHFWQEAGCLPAI